MLRLNDDLLRFGLYALRGVRKGNALDDCLDTIWTALGDLPPLRPSETAAGSFLFAKIREQLQLPTVLCMTRSQAPMVTPSLVFLDLGGDDRCFDCAMSVAEDLACSPFSPL